MNVNFTAQEAAELLILTAQGQMVTQDKCNKQTYTRKHPLTV